MYWICSFCNDPTSKTKDINTGDVTKDILGRAELGFKLDTSGVNLDMYVFLD